MPLAGYAWSSLITADTSSLAATETNIPLAHFLPDMTGKRLQASWYDVVPCLMDGTTVPDFYLEVKSDTVGVLHVEWPTLTAGQAALQLGYLNVGKADAVDLSNEAGTFGNNFAMRLALGEASGTLYDSTSNNNDGTQDGGLTFDATGRIGKAVTGDGINDRISIGNPASLQLSMVTLEAWFKTSGPGAGFRAMISKESNYYLGALDSVLISYDWAAGIQSSNINVADGLWHHAVVIREHGVANGSFIYLDGNLVKTWTGNNISDTTALALIAGYAAPAANAYNFGGTVDEISISSVARSASWAIARRSGGLNTLFSYGAWVVAGGLPLILGRAGRSGPSLAGLRC